MNYYFSTSAFSEKSTADSTATQMYRLVKGSSGAERYSLPTSRAMIYMGSTFTINNSGSFRAGAMATPTEIYEDDPSITSLSLAEISSEVMAMFGAWADRDDITDDFLVTLWNGWGDSLEELYNDEQPDLPV